MSRTPFLSAALIALLALSACGGGGGSDSGGGSSGNAYTAFSQRDITRTSTIGGHVVINGSSAEIRQIQASLSHNEGALTGFTDGTNTLNDSDGDDAGTWTNGTITLQPSDAQQGNYDYVALYNLVIDDGDGGPMIIGAITATSDIPTSGSATFSGEAFIDGSTTDSSGPSLTSTGTATVNVDYSGAVDLTITNVSGVPYDTITVTGMSLNPSARNTFSGGTLAIMNGSSDVTGDLIGTAPTLDAQGSFFGADGSGDPDEVGGVFAVEGANGEAYGGFLAD